MPFVATLEIANTNIYNPTTTTTTSNKNPCPDQNLPKFNPNVPPSDFPPPYGPHLNTTIWLLNQPNLAPSEFSMYVAKDLVGNVEYHIPPLFRPDHPDIDKGIILNVKIFKEFKHHLENKLIPDWRKQNGTFSHCMNFGPNYGRQVGFFDNDMADPKLRMTFQKPANLTEAKKSQVNPEWYKDYTPHHKFFTNNMKYAQLRNYTAIDTFGMKAAPLCDSYWRGPYVDMVHQITLIATQTSDCKTTYCVNTRSQAKKGQLIGFIPLKQQHALLLMMRREWRAHIIKDGTRTTVPFEGVLSVKDRADLAIPKTFEFHMMYTHAIGIIVCLGTASKFVVRRIDDNGIEQCPPDVFVAETKKWVVGDTNVSTPMPTINTPHLAAHSTYGSPI